VGNTYSLLPRSYAFVPEILIAKFVLCLSTNSNLGLEVMLGLSLDLLFGQKCAIIKTEENNKNLENNSNNNNN